MDVQEEDDVANCGGDEADTESETMPWSAFNSCFAFLKAKGEKAFESRCKLCSPGTKPVACQFSSNYNLKSHLKRKHNWSDTKLEEEFSVKGRAKVLKTNAEAGAGTSVTKAAKAKVDNIPADKGDFFLKRKVTQKDVDQRIEEFVICANLPHHIVDNPYFKRLVLLGLPSNLTVCCRQTLRKRFVNHFMAMKENVIKELQQAEYVASTADGWSKFHRGFIGMTASWLDPNTMGRKAVALALTRMKGRHTHDKIAQTIKTTYDNFKLPLKKLVRCTTDSAANFRKAFKVFGAADLPQNTNEEEDDGAEENNIDNAEGGLAEEDECTLTLMDLDDILNVSELEGIRLPLHQRCSAHLFNLIATTDAKAALDSNAAYKKVHDATDVKLREWWRRQNQSDLVAAALKEGFGVQLQVPGDTRWNSEFDFKRQIVLLHQTKGDIFNETLEKAGLTKLLASEIRYLQEYVWVMGPVALALDIIQRDKHMFAGYLIPTVLSMEGNLMLRKQMDGKNLKTCDVLVRTLLAAIRKPRRFELYLEDRELEMAACLLPCFQLNWITDTDHQADIKASILQEMNALAATDFEPRPRPQSSIPEPELTESCQGSSEFEVPLSAEEDFFGFEPEANGLSDVPIETAQQELDRYLKVVSRSWTVAACYGKGPDGKREFPRLAKLFLKYNTALPSSASVERFFSLAGLTFSSLRNSLGDETLQMTVLLNANKSYWSFGSN